MSNLKATILIDNNGMDNLNGEWGLSIFVIYNNKRFLIDAGSSSLLINNSQKLDIDLSKVDYAILSHAHYDHSNGFASFFEINDKAKLYLRESCKENCYSQKEESIDYIGIQQGFLEQYKNRLEFVDGTYSICQGVTLISHIVFDSSCQTCGMMLKEGDNFVKDNFYHEQSIVFETDNGLVVFNSCTHSGIKNTIETIKELYNKPVYALIGGFHLFKSTKEKVEKDVQTVIDSGVTKIITGHCTGDTAFEIFKDKMGEDAIKMHVGLRFEL